MSIIYLLAAGGGVAPTLPHGGGRGRYSAPPSFLPPPPLRGRVGEGGNLRAPGAVYAALAFP